MELGSQRRMMTFEPVDEVPAPAEPDVTVVPAEVFDELVADLDRPAEPVPALVEAMTRAAARVGRE